MGAGQVLVQQCISFPFPLDDILLYIIVYGLKLYLLEKFLLNFEPVVTRIFMQTIGKLDGA